MKRQRGRMTDRKRCSRQMKTTYKGQAKRNDGTLTYSKTQTDTLNTTDPKTAVFRTAVKTWRRNVGHKRHLDRSKPQCFACPRWAALCEFPVLCTPRTPPLHRRTRRRHSAHSIDVIFVWMRRWCVFAVSRRQDEVYRRRRRLRRRLRRRRPLKPTSKDCCRRL